MDNKPVIDLTRVAKDLDRTLNKIARALEHSNQIEIEKARDRIALTSSEDVKIVPTTQAGTEGMETYTTLGPECFTDGLVISYKGENYYKACGAFITDREDGGQSFCVRRVGHSYGHENYNGTRMTAM